MLHYVHSSTIYNSQNLERTQMSLSGGIDTEKCGIYTQWSTSQPLKQLIHEILRQMDGTAKLCPE